MNIIEYFKSTKKTNRFKPNQIVWIKNNYANHLEIRFRWRGRGRYVNGTIDKFAPEVGEIKEIEVSDLFFNHINQITLK